mgnify:CR=1 FL=1
MLHQSRFLWGVAAGLTALWLGTMPAWAWDYAAHRIVNRLALESLPATFPRFIRTPAAEERIAFLSGEPDRWRNTPDLALKHFNGPDHYLDLEELERYGLTPESLPVFRYDFVAHLAVTRKADAAQFPAPDPGQDADHTRQLVGMLPWGLTEYYGKLKSAFSYLKAFEEDGGTAEEIANAQANIIYIMGVMGHLAGDASQPLHTTKHHHGWVGDNPNGYSTSRGLHAWIDGGYFEKAGGPDLAQLRLALRPAQLVTLKDRAARPEEMFQACVAFLVEQHRQVEPLYQMEKAGAFSGVGPRGFEGKAFLENQLVKSAQLLGDLWFSAWQQAPPDKFLKGELAKRKARPQQAQTPSPHSGPQPQPSASRSGDIFVRPASPAPSSADPGAQPIGIPGLRPPAVARTAKVLPPTP